MEKTKSFSGDVITLRMNIALLENHFPEYHDLLRRYGITDLKQLDDAPYIKLQAIWFSFEPYVKEIINKTK